MRVAVYNRILCSRSTAFRCPFTVVCTVSTPESGSKLRSWPIIVPSRDVHQSRVMKARTTPSRLPPCQSSTPPGLSTRANSRMTFASSLGCVKNPKLVKRLSTVSKRPLHFFGSVRMSPRS